MREWWLGLKALIIKELQMSLKDKRSRGILIAPVIIQSVLFGYVATFDLNRIDYALLDEDHSQSSVELVRKFEGTSIFKRVATLKNADQIAPILDEKKASMVVYIPSDFERKLNLGEEAPVQLLTDGRNSNVAGAASSYAGTIVQNFNQDRLEASGTSTSTTMSVLPRVWYNPNLETRWSIMSSLTFLLSLIQVLMLSSQSLAREKESGSFDQLLVTPLSSITILIGKAIPSIIVGVVQGTLILWVSLYWFKLTFAGSYWWFYLGLMIFNLAVVGIGLSISAFSLNMQQAMLYCFALVMPMTLLSGFLTPIDSMPEIFQWMVLVNPVKYAIEFSKGVYLQGLGPAETYHSLIPLALIGIVSIGMACRFFRSRLS